uniref:BHLH domain-containing protein n=1 Tax=Steinernema glaseri TaxID=37863 RepID=A0A1I7YWR9_9BILA
MPSSSKSSSSPSSPSSLSKTASGKLPHQVHRRNERERKRVQQINNGYVRLRDSLSKYQTNSRKLSKVETLKAAIAYIAQLQDVLQHDSCLNNVSPPVHDQSFSSGDYSFYSSPTDFGTQSPYAGFPTNMSFDFQAYLRHHH